VEQRREMRAGGGAEPGGASGDAQPAAVVEPAKDQLPRGVGRADHTADDGLGGDPAAELLPLSTARLVWLVEPFGDECGQHLESKGAAHHQALCAYLAISAWVRATGIGGASAGPDPADVDHEHHGFRS
jgi:hypothetical protein